MLHTGKQGTMSKNQLKKKKKLIAVTAYKAARMFSMCKETNGNLIESSRDYFKSDLTDW